MIIVFHVSQKKRILFSLKILWWNHAHTYFYYIILCDVNLKTNYIYVELGKKTKYIISITILCTNDIYSTLMIWKCMYIFHIL